MVQWEISIHAPRVGSDSPADLLKYYKRHFNPRSPCGERPPRLATPGTPSNFNPRSPCGERPGTTGQTRTVWRFQSTLPVWGATNAQGTITRADLFQSTLPVWGATLSRLEALEARLFQSTLPVWGATLVSNPHPGQTIISIHAPRVGSDRCRSAACRWCGNFNPRSPCGERPRHRETTYDDEGFQSTLPVWGATFNWFYWERDGKISIHAPRVGSDRLVRL